MQTCSKHLCRVQRVLESFAGQRSGRFRSQRGAGKGGRGQEEEEEFTSDLVSVAVRGEVNEFLNSIDTRIHNKAELED